MNKQKWSSYVVSVEILCPDRSLEPKLSCDVADTSIDITCWGE